MYVDRERRSEIANVVKLTLLAWFATASQTVAAPPPEASSRPTDPSSLATIEDSEAGGGSPPRRKRSEPKPGHGPPGDPTAGACDGLPADDWRLVGYSTGLFRPEPGIDVALIDAVAAIRARGRATVYGFLLSDEYLVSETRAQLAALGAEVLGPHGNAYKVKLPADLAGIDAVGSLPWVVWLGLPPAELKLSRDLQERLDEPSAELAVFVNLFDDDPGATFGRRLEASGLSIDRWDSDLRAYVGSISAARLQAVAAEDFVLFVAASL